MHLDSSWRNTPRRLQPERETHLRNRSANFEYDTLLLWLMERQHSVEKSAIPAILLVVLGTPGFLSRIVQSPTLLHYTSTKEYTMPPQKLPTARELLGRQVLVTGQSERLKQRTASTTVEIEGAIETEYACPRLAHPTPDGGGTNGGWGLDDG
ncbi:hypothetical protein GQ44DRAFT_725313 [Phaeosphaeriaceae sp. PMI808]|nr:hypothetical protein GQ44DRAFT_725313 [Phaeosphaeriaceae sp. PMI808]